jgi:vancomycin permeability regulator SanA
MKLVQFIEFLRNRLKTVVRICFGLLALLILLDAVLVNKEPAHAKIEQIEHLPAFWSVFGFLGCVAIVIGSKWFGHAGIMTREDYYDE